MIQKCGDNTIKTHDNIGDNATTKDRHVYPSILNSILENNNALKTSDNTANKTESIKSCSCTDNDSGKIKKICTIQDEVACEILSMVWNIKLLIVLFCSSIVYH